MNVALSFLIGLVPLAFTYDGPLKDVWDGSSLDAREERVCRAVPDALVLPVPVAHRIEAMRLLERAEIASLRGGQVVELLGESVSGQQDLAQKLLGQSVAEMERQRDEELNHQIGSWSVADADDLAELKRYQKAHHRKSFRAYLVRAVARFENTGHFSARQCGDVIDISHNSLGHLTPSETRVPVVVFLDHAPKRAHAVAWVAE